MPKDRKSGPPQPKTDVDMRCGLRAEFDASAKKPPSPKDMVNEMWRTSIAMAGMLVRLDQQAFFLTQGVQPDEKTVDFIKQPLWDMEALAKRSHAPKNLSPHDAAIKALFIYEKFLTHAKQVDYNVFKAEGRASGVGPAVVRVEDELDAVKDNREFLQTPAAQDMTAAELLDSITEMNANARELLNGMTARVEQEARNRAPGLGLGISPRR